jgi:hypothetical protein
VNNLDTHWQEHCDHEDNAGYDDRRERYAAEKESSFREAYQDYLENAPNGLVLTFEEFRSKAKSDEIKARAAHGQGRWGGGEINAAFDPKDSLEGDEIPF